MANQENGSKLAVVFIIVALAALAEFAFFKMLGLTRPLLDYVVWACIAVSMVFGYVLYRKL